MRKSSQAVNESIEFIQELSSRFRLMEHANKSGDDVIPIPRRLLRDDGITGHSAPAAQRSTCVHRLYAR